MVILVAASYTVQNTYHLNKQKTLGQLVLGQGVIFPINHIANWVYRRQRKQSQIGIVIICEKSTRIDYDYNIGYKFMVRRNQAYKYKTQFQGLYEIIQMWTNGTVTIQTGAVPARLNIRPLKPYNNPEVGRDIHIQIILTYMYTQHI